MTFINNSSENSLRLDNNIYRTNENSEKSYFKIFIIGIVILLFSLAVFFIFTNFVFKTNVSNTKNKYHSELNNSNKFNQAIQPILEKNTHLAESNNLKNIKEDFLEEINSKDIFRISSSEPTGFYVMVGSFGEYKNAIKQQSMNSTKFTCHIFEANYNNINRVGLFISETDIRKAENALNEIKNMNKNSWLLYNSKN